MEIVELADDALAEAFPIVVQLRTHLDLAELRRRVATQRDVGYRLYAARKDGAIVGVLGMRPVDTLARGHHLHVDDLVVTQERRNARIGEALMAFAERWAAEHGCASVFLDARTDAMRFYARLGYTPHTATLVRKKIG